MAKDLRLARDAASAGGAAPARPAGDGNLRAARGGRRRATGLLRSSRDPRGIEHGRRRAQGGRMTTYETILVEQRGRVGLVTLNRPEALNALNLPGHARADRRGSRPWTRTATVGCIVITGSRKAFAAGADIKEMQAKAYMDMYTRGLVPRLGRARPRAHPAGRRGGRLRARRRLRAGDDVRLHHRRGQRQVRPAGDQSRRDARAWAARSG